jgi:replicative DNA helicase Mcm
MFKVIDRPDPANDAQMAEFILRNAMMDSEDFLKEIEKEDKITGPIDTALLKKYIKHARRSCFPTLSDEAKERIKEFYLELRGQYSKEDAVVSILARNLDALVRLSEAYAKMALRKIVIKEDVDEIIILFKKYLKDTGYDKETGKFDVDMILVGQSRSKINKLTKLMDRLKEIFEENDWKALEKNNIIQILGLDENLDKEFIKNAIEEAIKEGTLYEPKPDTIKFTRKQD